MEGRKDGKTEMQKLSPSAFLRNGGGQKLSLGPDLEQQQRLGQQIKQIHLTV